MQDVYVLSDAVRRCRTLSDAVRLSDCQTVRRMSDVSDDYDGRCVNPCVNHLGRSIVRQPLLNMSRAWVACALVSDVVSDLSDLWPALSDCQTVRLSEEMFDSLTGFDRP